VWSAVLAIFFFSSDAGLAKRWKPNPAALVSTLGVTFLLVVPCWCDGYAAKQAVTQRRERRQC